MLRQKKKEDAEKFKAFISENPKRFWSCIKSSTSVRPSPNFLRDGHQLVSDSRDRANIMNMFFTSVFNPASTALPPLSALPLSGVGKELDSIDLTVSVVREVFLSLDPNKACGPDNIPGSLLKKYSSRDSAFPVQNIQLICVTWGGTCAVDMCKCFPSVFKKDDPTLAENYQPFSLLCIVSKVRL